MQLIKDFSRGPKYNGKRIKNNNEKIRFLLKNS